jgi:hypothetical protein
MAATQRLLTGWRGDPGQSNQAWQIGNCLKDRAQVTMRNVA